MESYIKWKLKLGKFGMVPKHSFLTEMNSCLISTVPEGFYKRVEGGSINLKKAQSFCFKKEGVLLDNDKAEVVKADLVILATGFRGVDKLKDIFLSPTLQTQISGRPENAVPLYRSVFSHKLIHISIKSRGTYLKVIWSAIARINTTCIMLTILHWNFV